MTIQSVIDQRQRKQFHSLVFPIYKNHPEWIPHLEQDIEAVFDKSKNKFFRHGACERWIAYDDKNNPIGRISAFYSKKTAKKGNKQPTGGVGFFECIDNQDTANLLFDTAKKWLIDQGMEAMDGPINFGDRDRYWGLLIDGFDKPPNYMCNYNPEYYIQLVENYGFQLYFNQLTFGRNLNEPFDELIQAKAERIQRNSDYHFEHLKRKNLDKYAQEFLTIYNKAWAQRKGVATLTERQVKALMKSIDPIVDEQIFWFGYHKGTPIAFFLMLPEANQIFKHLNGNLNLLGKLKFLYYKHNGKIKKIIGTAFGIVPEFQGKGLEGALVQQAVNIVQGHKHYELIEMNWIGDFNPKMLHVCKQVGGDVVKKHRTYRHIFDSSVEVERHPIEN